MNRVYRARQSQVVRRVARFVVLGVVLYDMVVRSHAVGWAAALLQALGVAAVITVGWLFRRVALTRRLRPSLLLLCLLLGGAFVVRGVPWRTAATVLLLVATLMAVRRLPLYVAFSFAAVALGGFVLLTGGGSWLGTAIGTAGTGLLGYVIRQDAEARATAQRLFAQERAALAAEAETAALRERGRIAREIHDVLAHSLSAQTVHLEAARLLIERGGDRDEVLKRVVEARRMARQGLAETRQALSALRGEMTPLDDFLRELADSEGARLHVHGDSRALSAEVGLAVRRVAQEAMTNVRKHAPGAEVDIALDYLPGEVGLEVRDHGRRPGPGGQPGGGELSASGSGYGLVGMRERAELLGGTLDAGETEEGFVVRLRVPAA